ncbi:MAG: glucose-6-phosphate dehydrogenase assembly protein OpcA [Actinomycetes bacterium]
MTLRLVNTTSSAIARGISSERHRLGTPTAGMVLTLIVVTDEQDQAAATRAANTAASAHPCRILVLIERPTDGASRLDAEIDIGEREGPGETITMRLSGHLAEHQASVVLPLLLADTPVVVWWPAGCPPIPADDEVGILAQRRVTDSGAVRKPLAALHARNASYRPGDTDLAWTRLTPWRTTLAAAFDEPFDTPTAITVECGPADPSGPLLASWLGARLGAPAAVTEAPGSDIASVTIDTAGGAITLARLDATMASLTRPGVPTRNLPLRMRELADLLAEELRHLDSDEIYAQALSNLPKQPADKRTRGKAPS